MAMKTCMNILCGTTSCAEWKTGWSLRSGELANLCDKCGYAFEHYIYCEEFHNDDSGWRKCVTCGKRLHCGCIASLSLIELLDGGGVKCFGCAKCSDPTFSFNGAKFEGPGLCTVTENIVGTVNYKGSNGSNQVSTTHNLNTNGALGLLKQEGFLTPPAAAVIAAQPQQFRMDTPVGGWNAGDSSVSTLAQTSLLFLQNDRLDNSSNDIHTRDHYQSPAHPNLNITLGVPSTNLQFTSGSVGNEREQSKMSTVFHQGIVSPSLLPTPTRLAFSPSSDTNVNMMPQLRVARPPAEGRGRHQMLPRYWPRITDQELQQLSGGSNCTIVPLFEKILSASDAGRIGRLVLPKACAEAYFPPISKPEGLPLKIQDVKGKEWVFQFRYWPNNNSRMYVLEGVTACIQSMQLQAGDTVTFSRMDPGGKLVMGFRKGSNLQSTKGNIDTPMNALSRQLDPAGGNFLLHDNEKCGEQTDEAMLPASMAMMEQKKSRNIGSKSKRLLIDSQEVQALRLTWGEAQGMLRPPPNAQPTVVVIEDFEFEEYEEPPVFGKSSIFTARSTGLIEQWAQCDNCSKWRRLPADFLLPPKWTCAENAWDPIRCFCSAADELGSRELDCLLDLTKDPKKKRMLMSKKMMQHQESSGLNALANAAFLGNTPNEPGTSSVAATTKHPRHRPGCSCIVCIQPPSGKGKHKSTCTCTVCMTVKRRFKTLMMRKKKRQSEQEAEMALKNHQNQDNNKEDDKAEAQNNNSDFDPLHEVDVDLQPRAPQNNDGQSQIPIGALADDSNIGLDLNFHPERELSKVMPVHSSLSNLLQLANSPVESHVKQNGVFSLTSDQQAGLATLPTHPLQIPGELEGNLIKHNSNSEAPQKQANPSDGNCEPVSTDNQQSELL